MSPRATFAAFAVISLLWGKPARADAIDLDRVGQAALPSFPTSAPPAVPFGERVAGITIERTDADNSRSLSVTAGAEGCMMRGDDPDAVVDPDPDGERPNPRRESSMPLSEATSRRIGSFRHEQLISKGSDTELLVVRGWFDRTTLGVRQIDSTNVPLTVLSESPRIYAFRDGAALHLVVPTPDSRAASTRDTEGRVRLLSCSHVRVAIPLDAPAAEAVIVAAMPPPEQGPPGRHRIRKSHGTLHVSVSITRLSRDPRPWISLAVGTQR